MTQTFAQQQWAKATASRLPTKAFDDEWDEAGKPKVYSITRAEALEAWIKAYQGGQSNNKFSG